MRYYQLLIAVVLSLAVWSCKDEPDVPEGPQLNEQDREAMIEVFRALEMDDNEGFDFNDPKTWPGVYTLLYEDCNEYRVVGFQYRQGMPSNHGHYDDEEVFRVKPRTAGARISPALGRLTELRLIDIRVDENDFDCSIPSEIFDCPLEYLRIQGLGRYGSGHPFPDGIEKLRNTIISIGFSFTKFNGEIPEAFQYFKGSKLTYLCSNNCGFTGNIPDWAFTVGYNWWLDYNNLTGIDWNAFNRPIALPFPRIADNLMGDVVVPDWVTKTEGWKNFPVENKQHRNGNLKYEDGTDTVWP